MVKCLEWQDAMESEIRALEPINTWTLGNLPPKKTPIWCEGSRKSSIELIELYKIKHKADRIVKKYKARLVAKWYTQQEGWDFLKTFSSVAKMVTTKYL